MTAYTYTGNVQQANQLAAKNDALWYAFQGIGRAYLVKRGTAAASDADAASVHGYSTIQEAGNNPNIVDTVSQLSITQWNEYASLPAGGGTLGVIETVNLSTNGTKKQVSGQQNPVAEATGIASVTDFLSGIASANLWIRVAMVTGGGVMIILASMTGAGPSVVKTAVKAAPFL